MIKVAYVAVFVGELLLNTAAFACPDGQYDACAFGVCVCVPNGGTVTRAVVPALNPITYLTDSLTIGTAIVQGNIKQAYTSLGSMVTKASCPACEVALNIYSGPSDKAKIEEIVGHGWLTWITGEPALLLVNSDGSSSADIPLTAPPPPPIPQPNVARAKKSYIVADAHCAYVHDGKVASGWITPPSLIDAKSHAVAIFPRVDLQKGDIIEITSNKQCAVVSNGDSQVSSTEIVYDYSVTYASAQPGTMSYFLIGSLAAKKV